MSSVAEHHPLMGSEPVATFEAESPADRIRTPRPLRIVQMIFSRGFAGSERVALELANRLSEHHKVLLLVASDCDRVPGKSILSAVRPEVEVRRVSRFMRPLRVRQIVEDFNADIVHAHLGRAIKCLSYLHPKRKRCATLHLSRPVDTTALDGIILVSDWQRHLFADCDDDQTRFEVVPNFIDELERPVPSRRLSERRGLGLRQDAFVVGFFGRLEHDKGIFDLLRAFEQWDRPDKQLLIVGDGGVQDEIRERTSGNVIMTGFRQDARELYALVDCVVVPSRKEAFGLVALEAMAAGCRVVAANARGLAHFVASQPDIIPVIPGDPSSITSGLETAYRLRNEAPLYDLSDYEPSKVIPELEDFYLNVVNADLS